MPNQTAQQLRHIKWILAGILACAVIAILPTIFTMAVAAYHSAYFLADAFKTLFFAAAACGILYVLWRLFVLFWCSLRDTKYELGSFWRSRSDS